MATFEQLVHILRRLKNRSEDGGAVVGDLMVETDDTLTSLKACDNAYEDSGLSIEGAQAAAVTVGQTVRVRLDTPRPAFGLVRKNLDELLKFARAHVREPAAFFLLDDDLSKLDPVAEGHGLDRYRKVLRFVQVLKESAAFLDEQEEVLVFIRSGKFEVPVRYSASDLATVDTVELEKLSTAIPEGMHRSQCQSILAESIFEVLSKHAAGERFVHLLRNLREVRDRFDRGYQLFAAGFSYEKVRDQVEAARIEYTGKMHKVFSDIQNQLLGIPVATIVVATQMKPHDKISSEFWISVAVLLGSFVFALLVHFLLRNQRHTLEVIGLEIQRQQKELQKQPEAVAANFLPTFKLLDERYKTQTRLLLAIDAVVVGGVMLSLFFFYQLSGPARAWLDALVG